ncbi:MAG: helix-turn-helix domain-containing protein [Candidatus Hodarchaeales archaeon]
MSDEEQNKVEKTTYEIYKALKDESRLTIFLYLNTNQKLTLKQLSDALDKGKTTIHHHIRRLEDRGIVVWEEKKEDKKKLKTRYYSLNFNLLKEVFGIKTKK